MKSFKIEKEYGIDYVVIRFGDKDLRDFKKIIKENYNFLKNLNFKFILNDNKGDYFILYMKINFQILHYSS